MSSNTYWVQKVWEPEKWVSGKGVWGIGKVLKSRFHTVTTKDAINRYDALIIQVQGLWERLFNQYGNEVNPDFRRPQTIQNKQITIDAFHASLIVPEGMFPSTAIIHPTTPGVFELWMDPKVAKGIQAGQEIVFKTAGSFFLTSVAPNDGSFGNRFIGQNGDLINQVGSKMDKVVEPEKLAHEQKDGVDSDEWD